MNELKILSASEQVADYLREQLSRGIWMGSMPGGERLSRDLGVGRMTVEAALSMLEEEGLLVPQGVGKRRRIELPKVLSSRSLRIGLLYFAPEDSKLHWQVDLQHRLINAGHSASVAPKALVELGMDPSRISRMVTSFPADAWIVSSASREVLEWFAEQELPTFAIAGRRRGVKIASTGPEKDVVMRTLVQRLVSLGHRRIVLLAREVRRKPTPGRFEQVFLDELAAHGIKHSSFNMPDWVESPEGLQQVLDSLFRHTPPTALIVEEAHTMIATQQHLANNGIVSPRDVSLICDDPNPAFSWSRPSMAHIQWDGTTLTKHAIRWVANIARGKEDLKSSFLKADLVEGGTIGPLTVSTI